MDNDIQLTLARLRDDFISRLPDRLLLLENLLAAVERGEDNSIQTLHREAHSLVGAAGTYRLMGVSEAARTVERIAADLPTDKPAGGARVLAIRQALAKLNTVAEQPNRDFVPPTPAKSFKKSPRVLVVDDDTEQALWLRSVLEDAGYQVEVFDNIESFRAACSGPDLPAAIIMDMVFPEGDLAGAQAIAELKTASLLSLPVIFLSVRQDITSRLAAYRAGATRYLTKPVDRNTLLFTMDDAASLYPEEPYRVLLVDDDSDQLTVHAHILRQAGMVTMEVSDPLQVPKVLEKFAAEVMVLDMYMPQCSGPEVAAVLRDDARYSEIPIVYLSAETDMSRQLLALDRGGDHFLSKPVDPHHLVAATILHAKRFRRFREQSASLQATLYERERQQLALDTHAIVSVTDPSGKIIYINDKFCDISGYRRDELMGANHRIVKSGEHPPEFFESMWFAISSGKVWHGKICNRRKDGNLYWVETSIVPFLDSNGLPYQYIGIRTDITHIIEAEQRLRRSQIYANIGTWDWNIQTGALYWSERIAPLFGHIEGKLETTYENFLGAVHEEDRQKVIDAVNDCVEHGRDYNIEHRCVWPDGTVRWLQERGDVVRNQDGMPLHMLGVVQDIHERKLAETALVEARDEADRANRTKSEFLSSMSHELRTPMNAILGFGQLLQYDDTLGEDHKDNVKEILKAGEHLLELINDVLDLAKVESGHIDLSIEPVEVCPVVSECITLISTLAAKRNISISHAGLKGAAVRADRTRLRQVLLNLLSNAIKYNRDGGSIKIEQQNDGGDRLCILISDTGTGISEKNLKELFQPFNRLDAENSNVEGTGIGLTITRRIVEMMGGSVDVRSEVGVGSTFWIELPLESLSEAPQHHEGGPSDAAQQASGVEVIQHTVLYIEDNPSNIKLVAQLLGRRNHIHLLTAHTPELGIELALSRHPVLILLDINMPGMDGYQVLEKLKAETTLHHVPVVAVTANAMARDIERGMAAGFTDYLTKPLNVARFFETVDRCLSVDNNRLS